MASPLRPAALRRYTPWLALALLIAALCGLEAIFRGYQSPNLPVLDWIRPHSLQLRRWYMLGVLLVLVSYRGAAGRQDWVRFPLRALGLAGCLLVMLSLLLVQDFRFNTLSAEGESSPVPVVVDGRLEQRHWKSHLVKGRPLLLLPDIIRNERVVSRIARGLHQYGAQLALGAGGLEPAQAERQRKLRGLLWALQEGLTSAMHGLRGLWLPIFPWLAWVMVRGRRPGPRAGALALLSLWSLSLAIPVVNLVILLVLRSFGLPEGRDGASVLWASFGFLLVAGAVELAGRLFDWPRDSAPRIRASRGRAMGRRLRRNLRAVLPLLPALSLACGGPGGELQEVAAPPVQQAAPDSPNLLLLLIPGLRADPRGRPAAEQAFYGGLGKTPSLRFDAAYAQSSHPFTSLGSLLVGRYASAIPLCSLYESYATSSAEPAWCTRIPGDQHTLPEVLGIYGYRTAFFPVAFPGADLLAPRFQHWQDCSDQWNEEGTRWAQLNARVGSWFGQAEGPSFAVVVTPDAMVSFRDELRQAMGIPKHQRHEWIPPVGPSRNESSTWSLYARTAKTMGVGLSELIDSVESQSVRPLVVVVASTNGVNLGDLVGDGHAAPLEGVLLDGILHVPLAIFEPEATRTTQVSQVVELADILPTLLGLVGATLPASLPGEDLRSLAGKQDQAATAYAEFGDMLALRQGSHLLTFRCFLHGRSSLDPELTERLVASSPEVDASGYHLHDVVNDPAQMRNLSQQEWTRVVYMRSKLLEIRLGPGAPPSEAWSPENLWKLRFPPEDGYW